MMVQMGFFVCSDQRYVMTIPRCLSPFTVKQAVLRFVETEDEECVLHPERLLMTMRSRRPESGTSNCSPWIGSAAWSGSPKALAEGFIDRLGQIQARVDDGWPFGRFPCRASGAT
jgi:hypothetical protein